MYYIIENKDQLEKFSRYDLTDCFVDVITDNDNYHNSISNILLVYIKPFKSKTGFIIPINHNEAQSIPKDSVDALLSNVVGNIYAVDAKRMLYYFKTDTPLYCLKTALYLKEGKVLEEVGYNTQAHNFFYSRYSELYDVNKLIPISKHYEKTEKIINDLSNLGDVFLENYYETYGKIGSLVFYEIEKSGITINNDLFLNHFNLKNENYSIKANKVYTSYNIFTATGRPSNSFNGVNFSALNKGDESRLAIITSNDFLVEYDYSSYHLKILCNLIGYSFDDIDIHTHLAKYYYQKDIISKEEYSESKSLTFKLLYTESITEELEDNLFFSKVREYKNKLWTDYKINKVIKTPIYGKPITNIDSKTQILPYILQSFETEYNLHVIKELCDYLKDKKSKIVSYCYDSFLIDYSKKDGKDVLSKISGIFEKDGYKTSCKYGKNYHEMINI